MPRFAGSLLVVVSLIAATVSGAGGEKKATPKDNPDGTWVVIGMEQNGMKVPAEALEKLNLKLTLKGEDYTVTMAGKIADKGTSKVDTQKKPNAADIKSEEGPNKGKTILAIVEVTGDSMKACYDMDGKGRPTEFAAKEGSGHTLILYKREAKKEGD
ncbi:MAG TPA: TIGR03067 domain-containing protein [Gemmataceae bacterium]|nr:TIGR03067 domain-containing protein [Gemmataceae bacterium]